MLLFFSFSTIFAQVGINTERPKSSLQVQKKPDLSFPDGIIPPRISGDSLQLKSSAYTAAQNGAIVYVSSATTNPTGKTILITEPGLYSYDAAANNGNGLWNKILEGSNNEDGIPRGTYSMKASGSLTLLSLGINLLGSNFSYIPISNNTGSGTVVAEIPSSQVNAAVTPSIDSGYYVVPATGVYHIDYSFRFGQGLMAELLSGQKPGIVITLARNGASPVVLDSRIFGGVNLLDLGNVLGVGVVAASITLSQGQISHIYSLKKGDILRFGVVQGGLNLGILNDRSAELSIFRVR